ncbi:hypothetical protein IAD21_00092 [Abditibacteriota bacterium]|nr:hypothetical protein IAD21_00092 [Abditibacteriota bacterium]
MIRRFVLAITLLVAGSQIAFAQPATDAAPKDENPPNAKAAFPTAQQQQRIIDQTKDFMNMTPEKQKAYMRGMSQQILRSTMTRAGFKDQKLQDDILEFVDDQEKFREDVRAAAAKIYLTLEPQGVPTDAQGMETLVNDYLATVDEVKSEREVASKALDLKIGFSSKPHLRAFLLLNGIIGDAASVTGDIIMTGTMAIGSVSIDVMKRH